MKIDDPHEYFNRVIMSSVKRWGLIQSFRDFSKLSTPLARDKYFDNVARMFLSDHDLLKSTFPDMSGSGKAPEKYLGRFFAEATKKSEEQFFIAVDSASLIFAHSIVESCASNYCRLSAFIDPDSWEGEVINKKITVGSFKDAEYSELLRQKIENYLDNEFEYLSMIIKVETLISKCGGLKSIPESDVFSYDTKRTSRIHMQRNSVVHTEEELPGFEYIEDDLSYFQLMSFPFFAVLMNNKYGLKVDSTYLAGK